MCDLNMVGTDKKIGYCEICGSPFIIQPKGKTRLYCSDTCKDLNKYLNQVEDKIISINNNSCFVGDMPNQLKGRLLRVSNLIVCKRKVLNV